MTTGINTVEIVNNPVTVDVDNDNKISVNVTETKAVLEIGMSGPQGPKGDDGLTTIDSSGVAYIHIQSTPASTWTINHTLSFYPNVTVVDSAGSMVEGSIDYQSATVIVVNFSGAFSGKAYLS